MHGEPRAVPVAEPIVAPEPHERWTEAEVGFALARRDVMTNAEIASALTALFPERPRTEASVKRWFQRNGVVKQRLRRKARRRAALRGVGVRPRWTEAEVLALEMGEMQFLRHRSANAIYWKRWRLEGGVRAASGFMTGREVARAYGVAEVRVRRLIRAGVLPATKGGRDWRIDPADAERVLGGKGAPLVRWGKRPPPPVSSAKTPLAVVSRRGVPGVRGGPLL